MGLLLFSVCAFLLWEMLLHLVISPQFFHPYFPVFLCLVLASAGLHTLLIRLLPLKRRRLALVVSTGFFGLLYGSQLIYHAFFHVLYTVHSIRHGAQIAEFAGDILQKILTNSFPLLLLFLPLLTVALPPVWKRLEPVLGEDKPLTRPRIHRLLTPGFTAAFALLSGLLILFGSHQVNSPYMLLTASNLPLVATDRLGLITAMVRDATAGPGSDSIEDQLQTEAPGPKLHYPNETVESFTRPFGSPASSEARSSSPAQTSTKAGDTALDPQKLFKPQILPWLNFASLAVQEKNPALKKMDSYFATAEPSLTNAKTGKYAGYNFIFITAEGFSRFAPDPELTPTLYKLVHEGYYFTRFYNPIWGVSTSDGEYSGLLGTIPKSGVWSMLRSAENSMDYAAGNLLRRGGYHTYAYHNHDYDYYGRDKSHPNLGYDYKGLGHGLEVKRQWPESDLEMMEKTVDEYIGQEPFHAYYMTVSGHLQYSFMGNSMATKNREAVKNLKMSEEARAYMACHVELDKALEYLLKRLREAGVADHTLIALNADHYPYGLDKKTMDEFAGGKVEENFELYRGNFILYVDGMKPETVDKPACSLDCIATCYNLLGVPFDSRLMSGRDIFSPTEPLCIFLNRSWITDQGRYNALTGVFEPDFRLDAVAKTDPAYVREAEQLAAEIKRDPKPYVERINRKVRNRFAIAAGLLEQNYFRYLRNQGYGPREWKPPINNAPEKEAGK